MLDLADLQLEDRLVSFLMTAPENDGGQYTMAANLIQTFGLVPQQIYPESWNSSNTSHLDGLLTSKLREFALINRDVYDKALTTLNDRVGLTTADKKRIATESARKRKDLEAS
jgi:bleomycin hydrolase